MRRHQRRKGKKTSTLDLRSLPSIHSTYGKYRWRGFGVKHIKDICALAALVLVIYAISFFPARMLIRRYPGAVSCFDIVYYPLRYAFAERSSRDAALQRLEPYSQLCFLETESYSFSTQLYFSPVLSPRSSTPNVADRTTREYPRSLVLHPRANIASIKRLKPGDLFTPVFRSHLERMGSRSHLVLTLIDVIHDGDAVDRKLFQDTHPVSALQAGYVTPRDEVECFEYLAAYYRSGQYGLIGDIMGLVSSHMMLELPIEQPKEEFLIGWSAERIRQSLGAPRVIRAADTDDEDENPVAWTKRLKLRPNGTECVFWYGENGPPDHWPGDETYNLYFLLRDGIVIEQNILAP